MCLAALNEALLYCLLLVLLCGNVEQNPGPNTRYPCSLCYQPVCWNQKALLCDPDLCEKWTHCKCCSVDNYMYATYQRMECFSWPCPHCLVDTMPFHDCSVLTSDVTSTNSDVSQEQSSLMPVAQGLRIAHLNCQSLLPHKDEIFNLLYSFHLDVLTLSETWLDDTIPDNEILPGGCDYSLICQDKNHYGGGVAIFTFVIVRNLIFNW